MKCKDCKNLVMCPPQNNGTRCTFKCGHKNQKHIYDYFIEHRIHKLPAFLCYGGGLYGGIPTIKTSPAWCPLKKKGACKNETK